MRRLEKIIGASVFWLWQCAGVAHSADPVSFECAVLPLLEQRCNDCHNSTKQSGGLDLSRHKTMLRGGNELGAAIIPRQPDESPLIQVLSGTAEPAMPENGKPLPKAEIDLLRRWISEGARDDTPVFPSDQIRFFETQVRPVLAGHCFKCHAGKDAEHGLQLTSRAAILNGGVRGPAAVPGQPKASLLISAVRHSDDLKMPRGGDRLSRQQVAAFETWVELGLPWPSDEPVLVRERQFTISAADRSHWAFQPLPLTDDTWKIDSVLKAYHRRHELQPAPFADRHRLLRRVTFDLIGYPPTPEEIAAFLDDASDDAFVKVVDRLLASPHFGRHWGQHWLDYTRNGSTGQPTRGPAIEAERYADWVTRCFNEDRPWDWFVRVHLAGDLMPAWEGADYSIDQALAAAVPINGPRTFERAATETFVLMDKLDEGIEFLGRSLMGISLECARCHDHKYDPISQRDYYALLGFFQSSGHAPVPVATRSRDEAAAWVRRLDDLMREKTELEARLRRMALHLSMTSKGPDGLEARKRFKRDRAVKLAPRARRLYEIDLLLLQAERDAALQAGKSRLADDIAVAMTERESMLADFSFTPQGLGPTFDHFINGHKSQVGLIERAERLGMSQLLQELAEHNQFWPQERAQWLENYRFGGFMKSEPEATELARLDDRVQQIVAELPANLLRQWEPPADTHAYVRCEGGMRRAEELRDLEIPRDIILNVNDPRIEWFAGRFIGDSRLLERGDVLSPGDLVPRGFPAFFDPAIHDSESPFNNRSRRLPFHGSGRLELAEWLTQEGSVQAALVARAAVNRVWQNLFGEGLCRTPKELGRLGEVPEMPDLADGLAAQFVRDGWSVRSLVRSIVLSEAYQRSSSQAGHRGDPENRYFARQSVRRLPYESIANTMAWLTTGNRFRTPKQRDAALPAAIEYRRQFDPPPAIEIVDRRTTSITATQALFLMNQTDAARGVADKILERMGTPPEQEPIFLRVLQRPPSARELNAADGFESPADFLAALLCTNEVIFIE